MTYIAAMWARTTKVCHLSPRLAQPPASGCPSVVPPFYGRKEGRRSAQGVGAFAGRNIKKEKEREREENGLAPTPT